MWALRQVPAPTAMMRYNWSTACERQIAGTMDHCTYSSVFIEDAERSISLNWQPLYDIDLFFAFLWFTKSLVLVLLLYIHLLTPVYTGLIGDFLLSRWCSGFVIAGNISWKNWMPWRFTESLHTAEVTRLVQKFFGKSCCESLALDDLIFYDSLDLHFSV